jgi:RNA polymerase sigma-70 factor (ECF subfamily)
VTAGHQNRATVDDGDAFVAALFVDHSAFLLRTAFRMTGNKAIAEEVVQEAFLVAHAKQGKLTGAPVELRGWLYRVVANLSWRQRRSFARRMGFEARYAPSAEGQPADVGVVSSERVEKLRRIVGQLPWKEREVFVLYELDELSGKEIAALVGVAEGTVWARLHAARKSLKEIVARGDP